MANQRSDKATKSFQSRHRRLTPAIDRPAGNRAALRMLVKHGIGAITTDAERARRDGFYVISRWHRPQFGQRSRSPDMPSSLLASAYGSSHVARIMPHQESSRRYGHFTTPINDGQMTRHQTMWYRWRLTSAALFAIAVLPSGHQSSNTSRAWLDKYVHDIRRFGVSLRRRFNGAVLHSFVANIASVAGGAASLDRPHNIRHRHGIEHHSARAHRDEMSPPSPRHSPWQLFALHRRPISACASGANAFRHRRRNIDSYDGPLDVMPRRGLAGIE